MNQQILWFLVFCFHGIPECENMWVSASMTVSSAFSSARFFLCVLSYLDMIVFVSHYYILLFSNERQERGWTQMGEVGGAVRGIKIEKTTIMVYYTRKKSPFNKET